MKKIFRQSIAALLISSMLVILGIPAQAASNQIPKSAVTGEQTATGKQTVTGEQTATGKQTVTGEQTATGEKAVTGYEAVKEVADKKTKILASMYGAASVQYALIDNGEIKISGSNGVYSKETKEKVSKNNMYGIGSISKVFTTAAVMQLVDDGKVKLDEPVITYIPEFKMADERYKKITVRMLLNHSSGLMGGMLTNVGLFENSSSIYHDNFLKTLESQRLKANPGAFSVYCNDGFTLAEILVERVSGRTFTEYMESNITKPLAMKDTKTPKSSFDRKKLVKAYVPNRKEELPTNSFNAIGAGGIYSSAEDLCRFATMFMKDSAVMLTDKSILDMEQKEYLKGLWPMDGDSILSFGLGWDGVNTYPFNQYGIKALSKGGDTYLYHGNMTVLPEYNMAVAVLSSGSSSALNQIAAQEILLTALKEKGIIKEIILDKTFSKPKAEKVPENYGFYEGIYLAVNGSVKITMEEDKLLMSMVGTEGAGTAYSYVGNHKFVLSDGSTTLRFVREKNDKIYLKVDAYASAPGLGQTAAVTYSYEKAQSNKISQETENAWKNRIGKKYFMIDERFNSQLYMFGLSATELMGLDGLTGYVNNAVIVDENLAQTLLEIPGSSGRDLSDYSSYEKDNAEYMNIGGRIAISSDSVKNLSVRSNFKTVIGKDGYAKIYSVPKKAAGKVITVKVPKNASYAVYDKDGNYVNFSWVSKEYKTKLPAGGHVLFMGSPNAEFVVNYEK